MLILKKGSGLRIHATGSTAELNALNEHLKVKVNNWFFARKNRPAWDGTESFFNPRTQIFSLGLLHHVRCWLKEKNIRYALQGSNPPLPELKQSNLKDITLRDNQLWAINRWLQCGGIGVIVAPPGSGKTEMASAIVKHIGVRTLFVVNSLDLLMQARGRLETRLGHKVGVLGGGEWHTEGRGVLVATIQTLTRALGAKKEAAVRELIDIKLVIYDECHHSRSAQTKKLLRFMPNANFRLGLSARPFHKYDREDLQKMTAEDVRVLDCMGPVVAEIQASDLIAENQLARPRIYLVPFESDDLNGTDRSWAKAKKTHLLENLGIVSTIVGAVKSASAAGELSLVVVGSSRRYGLNVYFKLHDAGVDVIYLHGTVDKMRREWARRQANRGRLEAIVATVIYDEGVDLPELRQLILAYGGLSAIKLEQRLGRSLRHKSRGQNVSIVVDFISFGNRHLRKHSLSRIRQYLEQPEFEVYLIGSKKDFPSSVMRLLGRRLRFVGQLPDRNYFMELKNESDQGSRGVQAMAGEKVNAVPDNRVLPKGFSDSPRKRSSSGVS